MERIKPLHVEIQILNLESKTLRASRLRSQEDLRRMIKRKDTHKNPKEPRSQTRRATESHSTFLPRGCKHCGAIKYHDFRLCPNSGVKCEKCDMNGHSTETCFSSKRVKEKTMPQTWKRGRSASTVADERQKLQRHFEYDTTPPRTQERGRVTNSPIRNISAAKGAISVWRCAPRSQAPDHPTLPGHPRLPICKINDPGTAREQAERWISDNQTRYDWAEEQEAKWKKYFDEADKNPAGPNAFDADGQEMVEWWEEFIFNGSRVYGSSTSRPGSINNPTPFLYIRNKSTPNGKLCIIFSLLRPDALPKVLTTSYIS